MKKKISLLALTGVFLFLSVFTLIQSNKEDTLVVSAQNLHGNLSTITPYPPSVLGLSEKAIQKYAHSETISSSAHGVEISAANFRIDENIFRTDVCYQYPSNADWTIGEAIVQIQNIDFPLSESRGIEIVRSLSNGEKRIITFPDVGAEISMPNLNMVNADGLPDYRCDTMSFRLKPDLIPSRVKLTIKYINAFPSEGQGCYEYREAVQSILKSKEMNIKIDCSQNASESSTRTKFIIVEKPSSLNQEEAEKLVRNAYRESFTIQGPWVFQGEVINATESTLPAVDSSEEVIQETVTPAP